MQFTGSQLLVKRSFYTQSGNFGVGLNCTVNNTTGTYTFGVSGDQGTFEFTLQSGRITQNGVFLHTYQSNRAFALEAQFNTGAFNVVKDGAPMAFGQPKATGNYSYFYFKRASTDMSGTFSLYVTGESIPSYTLQNSLYLTASGQNAVTGYFLNQSAFPVRIFGSSAVNPQNTTFGALAGNLVSGASGSFAFTGDFSQFDFTQAVLTNFTTNFGPTYANVYIYDVRAYSTYVTFAPIADFSFNTVNQMTRTLFYNNWSGQFQSNGFNAALNFRLDYVSGTGSVAIAPYALTTGVQVSGFFNQTGNYSGLFSLPLVLSGNSGTFTGLASQIGAYAEGTGQFSFSGRGTGAVTGWGFTGQTSGAYAGFASGFSASGQTGLYRLSGVFVGSALPIVIARAATGYLSLTGFQYGDILVIGYNSGNQQQRFSAPTSLTTGFFEGSGLVANLARFPTAYGLTGTTYASGFLLLTGITGGNVGNTLRIYSQSGNVGYVTGTNAVTGFGSDTYGSITISYNSYITLTGGLDTTGYAVTAFTGSINAMASGSGQFSKTYYGPQSGGFSYTRTFTGNWDLLTGYNTAAMVSLKVPGGYNDHSISGTGNFIPNGNLVFQVTHNQNLLAADVALLTISGAGVISGISQLLYN